MCRTEGGVKDKNHLLALCCFQKLHEFRLHPSKKKWHNIAEHIKRDNKYSVIVSFSISITKQSSAGYQIHSSSRGHKPAGGAETADRLRFYLRWNSSCTKSLMGLRDAGVWGRGKTHRSEVVNLCSRPQVHPRLSDMLDRSTLSPLPLLSPTSLLMLSAINLFPVILWRGGEKKSLSNFVKNSLFCLLALKSTTRELYIWVPAPDDVKTGADPKPVAQRVPQRGRLRVVFPSCASVTSSCRGEPRGAIWGGPGPERGGTQSSKFQLAWQGRWGTGDWGRRGELGPPACTSNCLNIHFPYSLLYRRGDSYCHVED